jgi:hypothetical protein
MVSAVKSKQLEHRHSFGERHVSAELVEVREQFSAQSVGLALVQKQYAFMKGEGCFVWKNVSGEGSFAGAVRSGTDQTPFLLIK